MYKATSSPSVSTESPKAIRVLMVVRLFIPWVGGMERQAHKLALALKERGIDVKIATGWWFRGTRRKESIDDIPVFRNFTLWECFGIKGLRKLGGYLYIVSLMVHLWHRRVHYDVIHVHGLSYHTFATVLAGRWLGRPVIVKLANSGPASDIAKMRSGQQLALSRYLLPAALRADCFAALNRLIVRELIEAGVPAARIAEIPNGVSTAGVAPKTDYSLHHPVRLVFVGRLHPQKGLEVLLKALRRLRDDGSEVGVTLVGDGPQKMQLKNLASELGIRPHVKFAGESSDVQDYLRDADVFVLPSKAEGISNALLEAMAQGLPVVVSDIPGNAEVVDDEKTGIVFHRDDVSSLAARLQSLLQDQALRQELGDAARREIDARYAIGRIAERYIGVYQGLLSRGAHPQADRGRLRRGLAYPN
jgi:glycosyltransferase involved in cell wall biosynthesis